jgi:agmatine deiminase
MRTITESESTPKADGFYMPAEWAEQKRVWMGWPHRTDTWAHGAKPAQKQYEHVARTIAEFTPVYMCANQVDYANCKAVFEDCENVHVIEMTTDDAWFRDTGATYVVNGEGDKRAVHWHFNAYGGMVDGLYFPWDKDEQIALKMCELSEVVRYRPDDMILEGGSITVDGEGTVVVTDQCLLSPGRTCSAGICSVCVPRRRFTVSGRRSMASRICFRLRATARSSKYSPTR